MTRSFAKLMGTYLTASTMILCLAAQPALAQTPVDSSTPVRATATRVEDGGFHWGWLGAVGLLGLLGLSGASRRHPETMNRATAVRP